MINYEKQTVVREAMGVFPNDDALMAAIDELEQKHFARQDISVVTNEADMRAPRGSIHVMPEEQSLAQAAFVGIGALIGVVIAMYISIEAGVRNENVAAMFMTGTIIGGLIGLGAAIVQTFIRRRNIQRQMRRGGLLLWVSTPTRERERVASNILSRNGARDVRIQQVVLS